MDKSVDEPSPSPNEEAQLYSLLSAMEAAYRGDFSHRLPAHGTSRIVDRLAETLHAILTRTATLTQEVTRVLGAVAEGDLHQKVPLEFGGEPVKGEFLHLATAVNGLVDRLSSHPTQVTHAPQEVGTEGKLGGQSDT